MKSEFNEQKNKLELLTVNYEDLKTRNAQLTADADHSSHNWNLKEETFLSQVICTMSYFFTTYCFISLFNLTGRSL